MSNHTKKPTDHTAINEAFRFRPNRVHWVPSLSTDLDEQKRDRARLNEAIRKAAKHRGLGDLAEDDTPDDGA